MHHGHSSSFQERTCLCERLATVHTRLVLSHCVIFPEKLHGNKKYVEERHRHRYEVNPDYVDTLEKNGLKFVGKSSDNQRMEILEIDGVLGCRSVSLFISPFLPFSLSPSQLQPFPLLLAYLPPPFFPYLPSSFPPSFPPSLSSLFLFVTSTLSSRVQVALIRGVPLMPPQFRWP